MDLDFKQIRQIEFEILLVVNQIASALGIKYYLDFGTLLGACRHQGFIPWDDDIDIAMSPGGIELFCRKAPISLPRHLKISRHPAFPPAIKVSDIRYNVLEISKLTSSGTTVTNPGIDIFPFGFFRMQSRLLPLRIMGQIAQKRPTAPARAKRLFLDRNPQAVAFMGIATVPKIAVNFFGKITEVDSGLNWDAKDLEVMVGHGLGIGSSGIRKLSYSSVFPLRHIEFERLQFLAPNDPDHYLTKLYGDWRRPVQFPQHVLRGWTVTP